MPTHSKRSKGAGGNVGRPKLPESERARNLTIRITPDNRATLELYARDINVTLSAMVSLLIIQERNRYGQISFDLDPRG